MISDDLNNWISSEGETVSIQMGYRMLLHDLSHFYFIESGDVDLFILHVVGLLAEEEDPFFIKMSETNRCFLGDLIIGSLTFLCNATENQVIYPFEITPNIHPNKIILKANNKTVIRKVSLEKIAEAIEKNAAWKEEFMMLTEKWILNLSGCLKLPLPQGEIHYLENGITQSDSNNTTYLLPRHRIHSHHMLLGWVKLHSGTIVFFHETKTAFSNQTLYLPITPTEWFQFLEPGEIELLTFRPSLKLEELFQAVLHFHNIILTTKKETEETEKSLELVDIAAREETSNRRFSLMLGRLGTVLEKGKKYKLKHVGVSFLEALEIIADSLGRKILPTKINKEIPQADQVYSLCSRSKIFTREVNLTKGWWKQAPLPLLVEIIRKSPKPAAALPTPEGQYELIDPDNLMIKQPIDSKLSKRILQKATLFYQSLGDALHLPLLKILTLFTKPCKRDFLMVLLSGLLATAVSLFIPFFNEILFDEVFPSSDYTLLQQLILGMIVLAITQSLFILVRGYAIMRIQSIFTHNLESALWIRMLELPLGFFRKFSTGDLYNRISSVTTIRDAIAGNFSRIILDTLFSVIYFFSMFYYSLTLTGISLILFLIGTLIGVWAFRSGITIQRKIQEIKGEIYGKVLQIIGGISKIKIYGVEKRVFTTWAESLAELIQLEINQNYLKVIMTTMNTSIPPVMSFIIMTGFMLMRYWNAEDNIAYYTLGRYMAFSSAFMLFSFGYFSFLASFMELLHVIPTWERSRVIIDSPKEVKEHESVDIELKGKIELSHIFFRYDQNSRYIHRDISLHADPGEFIAIVGRVGCGKSTLIKLLLGFETAERGGVFFDDNDLSSLDIQQVRSQIGVVSQNCKVIDATIRENITGGKICSHKEVMEAVKIAGLEKVIEELPMGLRTYLSHGVETLSGGQLQRMFIARALIGKPKILILDEATNALDNTTQRLVIENIDHLNVTRILIAHRLNTVVKADRIYVMREGRIVEFGNYEELMKMNGYFSKLVELQRL